MRISSINYNHILKYQNTPKNVYNRKNQNSLSNTPIEYKYNGFPNITFTSLMLESEYNNLYLDTAFYRDMPTLLSFAEQMKANFPNGADIMDFACSNGEEAVSIYSLLGDNKYKIYCYDISDKALDLAKNNVYFVNSKNLDSFLIVDDENNASTNSVKKLFYEIMEEIPQGKNSLPKRFLDFLGNGKKDSFEKYFKIKDEYLENFKFEKADIQNIQNIMPEKQVGAIFFRNAIYNLTNNHPFDAIYDLEVLQKMWDTDKVKVLDDFSSKIWKKLLPGGFLVLGTSAKEHIYQADKYTPEEDIFQDYLSRDLFRSTPLLEEALKKDGKFAPVFKSVCKSIFSDQMPVFNIWQKVVK